MAEGYHSEGLSARTPRLRVLSLVVAIALTASIATLASCSSSEPVPTSESDGTTETVYGKPDLREAERTVESYYEDILSGGYDAALARIDMPQEEAHAVVAIYSDSDAILDSHELQESVLEDAEAVLTVEEIFVNEMGDQLTRDVVYALASVDGEMLITSVSSNQFDPIANAESVAVYPREAEIAVDAFLGFIAIGEWAEAEQLATAYFASEEPEYFDGSLAELASWDILGSEQLTSERMRVRVEEEWESGTVTVDYQAVLEGEELKVDTVAPVN